MAKKTVSDKKSVRTLRQTTEDKASTKRRSIKAPVGKIGAPFRKVKKSASQGRIGKVGRFLVPKYFRDSWVELKQVSWPDRLQTLRLTGAVIAFAVVFGIAIAIVDYGLDKLFRQLLIN